MAQRASAQPYELEVVGGLGPALRSALLPRTAGETEPCTIVRVRVEEQDLVDLVRLLDREGFDIDAVRPIT